MTMASHFRAGDRVRTVRPLNVFETNRSGTILHVFFGVELYDVLFDGHTKPHMVAAERLREETGMPIQLADNPLESVVLGAGKCVEDFDALQQVLVPDRRR